MPNPPLLLCDSDALVQFFLMDDLRPLQVLRTDFQIQPTITLEVDLELRWMRKHKNRFVPKLDKALKSGLLTRLDQTAFQGLLGEASPGTSWQTYQALGARYELVVQRGEAYTHAAAVSLGMPAMSNDQKAVLVLTNQMMSVATPVLRSFDLLVFANQIGTLDMKQCEEIRSELLTNGEGLPGPFLNSSFAAGAKTFPCRLRIGNPAEAPFPQPTTHYDPLVILRR
jgi:hypothetical protein